MSELEPYPPCSVVACASSISPLMLFVLADIHFNNTTRAGQEQGWLLCSLVALNAAPPSCGKAPPLCDEAPPSCDEAPPSFDQA